MSSKETLRQKIGDKAFRDFFGDISKEGDDVYFDKLEMRFQNREQYGSNVPPDSMNISSPTSAALDRESVFEHEIIFNTLKDVFELLDKGKRITSSNNNLKPEYIDFLNTLFDGVSCVNINTYGYSFQNIYMCLFHFELVFENLIVCKQNRGEVARGEEKEEVKEKDDITLQELTTWIRRTARFYKCNFSRNAKVISRIYFVNPGSTANVQASSLHISFCDDKPERLIAEGSSEDLSSYAEEICKLIKVWLFDKWSANHKNIAFENSLLKKEYDEYCIDMKKKEIKEIKKEAKIFTQIESIATICYAILACDYCEGIGKDKITQDKAVKLLIEKKYHREQNEPFPANGVKKQLGLFYRGINDENYSEVKKKLDDVLQQQPKSDREFFPYPLFTNIAP